MSLLPQRPSARSRVESDHLDVLWQRSARHRQFGYRRQLLDAELMQKPVERGVGVLLGVGVVRHWHDDLRLELMDDLGGLRRGEIHVATRDGHEHDVHVADALEIDGGKLVAEVAEVADDEVVQPDREYRVPSPGRAFGVVVEARDARHEDLVDLVLAWPAQHHGLPANGLETRVAGVLVRDRDDSRLCFCYGVPGLWVGRVGQHDALAAAHPKTGMTEPGQVHGTGREYAK